MPLYRDVWVRPSTQRHVPGGEIDIPEHTIDIQVDNQFESAASEAWLRHVVKQALAVEELTSVAEVGLVIADDARVERLNREYRGEASTTDVLSFALEESMGEFVPPPDNVRHLGEVVISYPQAARQAREQGHSVERELALLVAHGVLHLLGYDHDDAEAEARMRAREAQVLAAAGDDRLFNLGPG